MISFGVYFLGPYSETTEAIFSFVYGEPRDWALAFILVGVGTLTGLILNGLYPRGTPVVRMAGAVLRSGFWLMLAGASWSLAQQTFFTPLVPLFAVFTMMEWIAAIKSTWDYKVER